MVNHWLLAVINHHQTSLIIINEALWCQKAMFEPPRVHVKLRVCLQAATRRAMAGGTCRGGVKLARVVHHPGHKLTSWVDTMVNLSYLMVIQKLFIVLNLFMNIALITGMWIPTGLRLSGIFLMVLLVQWHFLSSDPRTARWTIADCCPMTCEDVAAAG